MRIIRVYMCINICMYIYIYICIYKYGYHLVLFCISGWRKFSVLFTYMDVKYLWNFSGYNSFFYIINTNTLKELMNWTSESKYERITDSETEGETIVVVEKNTAATESTQEKANQRKRFAFSERK